MTKIITITILGAIIVVLAILLSFDTPAQVGLVKTWELEEIKPFDGFMSIGNGLYGAIEKCHEGGGMTSIQGRLGAEVTCITEDGTYTYENFNWRGFVGLKK